MAGNVEPAVPPVPGLARRRFETSDGVWLSFLESPARPRDRPILAFVPGWCMPASVWMPQLERFGATHHCIALDPRGQGESAVPGQGYSAERRAADLHEFLKPYARVVLVGWSLAALEALHYIHLYGADRLAGLVLVDSSVGEEPVPAPSTGFVNGLRDDRDRMLDEFVRAIFGRRSEAEIAALIQGAKRMALADSIELLSWPIPREHWKKVAHGFTKPLLYAVTPQFADQARNLARNRPGTQIEIHERAGHALFADEPERFNARILRFINDIRRG